MTINHYLILFLVLFFIRLIGFGICLPNTFDNIWKPGEFSSFSSITYALLSLVMLSAFVFFIKKIGKSDNRIKNSFFLYFLFIYFSYLLFNRTIETETFDYLVLLHYSTNSLNDLLPNLILDFFFEPPYLIWGLAFIGLIYYVCKKYNHIEYALLFWIIPFSFFQYKFNDITATLLISYSIITILGIKYAKKNSSFFVMTLLLIINLGSVLYSFYLSKLNPVFFMIAIETIMIFFLPAFIICFICRKTNNKELTWILPLSTMFFINLPMLRLQTGICLVYFIDFISLFLFVSDVSIIISLVFCLTYISKKVFIRFEKIAFYLFAIIIVVFYMLDISLYYYSQFRINYQTLAWTQTMNDITRTTLATCLNYLSPLSLIIFLLTFFSAIMIIFKGKIVLDKYKSFKFNLLFILLISHLSNAILQISNPLPEIFNDPVFELIKSIPFSDYFKKTRPLEEIEKGFKECGISLKKYSEKDADNYSINKTNVIIITLESVHWKYVNMFGKEPLTWPNMSKYKDRMEIFPYIYSPFPESSSGDYAVLTGLVPYDLLYLHKNPNIRHKSLVDELKKYNYNSYLFSSESLNDGGLNNLVKFLPFDYIFSFYSKDSNEFNSWEWGYKEEYTTKTIIDYLTNRNSDKPYFLWYRTVYPHAPFTLFAQDSIYPFQEKDEYGLLTLVSKYKNSLLYLDAVLYKFIENITELDKKNNQKTLIILIGDHGEKLKEEEFDYTTGHGLNTTPSLQNVACIFIKPQNEGLKINNNYGSQIDILPTVLDYLKITPSVERYEQGESLYKEKTRPIFLSSIKSYAIIENGYFFEFRNKNKPNFRVTKLGISKDNLKPTYENLSNWPNHEEIYEKYQRVKKFFELQEEFLNQLK